jgi:hypothetical protein
MRVACSSWKGDSWRAGSPSARGSVLLALVLLGACGGGGGTGALPTPPPPVPFTIVATSPANGAEARVPWGRPTWWN